MDTRMTHTAVTLGQINSVTLYGPRHRAIKDQSPPPHYTTCAVILLDLYCCAEAHKHPYQRRLQVNSSSFSIEYSLMQQRIAAATAPAPAALLYTAVCYFCCVVNTGTAAVVRTQQYSR